MPEWHYTPSDLIEGFQTAGIQRGDLIMAHVCIETLGQAKDCSTPEQVSQMFTWRVARSRWPGWNHPDPTYTFSFPKREVFDVQHTPTMGGPWSTFAPFLEYFRTTPGVIRSADPIHSIAGMGPKAEALLTNLPHTCFGEDSVFDRFKQAGGKICTIGVGLHEAQFLHHVEEMATVPFRFKKLFPGYVQDHGVPRKEGWIYYVRILADNSLPDQGRLEQKARAAGLCKAVRVGCDEIRVIDSRDHFDLTMQELTRDPWFHGQRPCRRPDPTRRGQSRRTGLPDHTARKRDDGSDDR